MRRIPDENLKVYMVWLPILPADDRAQAEAAASMPSDPRVSHYWIQDAAIAELFKGPIGLAEEKAWNVYLLYGQEARWGAQPPRPRGFMHQGRKLPDDRLLDARKLADEVRALLGAGPSARAASSPRR